MAPKSRRLGRWSMFVLFGVVIIISGVTQQVNAASISRTFKNCSTLNKAYSKGVTKSLKSAKLTGAKYSLSLYRANYKLDRDADGIACERIALPTFPYPKVVPTPSGTNTFMPTQTVSTLPVPVTTVPVPVTTVPVPVTTIPVPVTTIPVPVTTVPVTCESISPKLIVQNVSNVTLSHKSNITFPDVLSGFEVTREVSGQLKNDSSVEVWIATVIAKSLYMNGLNKDSPYYDIDNSTTLWVPLSKTSIAKNSTLEFSYRYVQYVTAPFGSFVDSFNSKVDVHMEIYSPRCIFDK